MQCFQTSLNGCFRVQEIRRSLPVRSRAADLGFNSLLRIGMFPCRVIPVTSKLALQWRYRVSSETGWPGVVIL